MWRVPPWQSAYLNASEGGRIQGPGGAPLEADRKMRFGRPAEIQRGAQGIPRKKSQIVEPLGALRGGTAKKPTNGLGCRYSLERSPYLSFQRVPTTHPQNSFPQTGGNTGRFSGTSAKKFQNSGGGRSPAPGNRGPRKAAEIQRISGKSREKSRKLWNPWPPCGGAPIGMLRGKKQVQCLRVTCCGFASHLWASKRIL